MAVTSCWPTGTGDGVRWVRNAGRAQEEHQVLTLGELREAQVDMFTTVFIGSAATRRIGDRMVTPRGYEL